LALVLHGRMAMGNQFNLDILNQYNQEFPEYEEYVEVRLTTPLEKLKPNYYGSWIAAILFFLILIMFIKEKIL